MTRKTLLTLTLNGEDTDVATQGTVTLLETLREDMGVLSVKRGCNQGVCGSCTVVIDGAPVRSCLTLSAMCEGRDLRTIEGYEADRTMKCLQKHLIESGGIQCGFCTSGVLLSAQTYLTENASPNRAEVKSALSGNLCRCTGYRTIVDAVCDAAEELAQ